MTFRVGQKVVCVNATGVKGIAKGRVYVVSYVYHDGCIQVGFDPRPLDGFIAYSDYRFRLAAERKTDISIFTSMLNPSKQGVDA